MSANVAKCKIMRLNSKSEMNWETIPSIQSINQSKYPIIDNPDVEGRTFRCMISSSSSPTISSGHLRVSKSKKCSVILWQPSITEFRQRMPDSQMPCNMPDVAKFVEHLRTASQMIRAAYLSFLASILGCFQFVFPFRSQRP